MRIMFMSGPDDGLELTLINDNSFTIGRRESSHICIAFDTSVSRLHARLAVRDDGLWLVDEKSRNGTFISHHRVKEPELLRVGELFRVGNTWLRVQSVE